MILRLLQTFLEMANDKSSLSVLFEKQIRISMKGIRKEGRKQDLLNRQG